MTPEAWPRLDSRDIFAADAGSVRWLIEPLLPQGALVILAAGAKTGKSWFAYKLALDVALGRSALGALADAREVAVFQAEMPRHEDARRWRRLAIGSECLDELRGLLGKRLHLYTRPLALDLNNSVEAFLGAVRDAEFVVIDSLLAAFPGLDTNANAEVRLKFSNAFYRLTNAGVTVLLLHHMRKPASPPPGRKRPEHDEVDAADILGAQAICAAADVIYSLTRQGGVTMQLKNVGSWVSCGPEVRTFKVYDQGDGTVVLPMAGF